VGFSRRIPIRPERRLLLASFACLLSVIGLISSAQPSSALIQSVSPSSDTVTAGSSTSFTVTVNSPLGGSCLTATDLLDPTVGFQYSPQCHGQSGTWTSLITVSTTAGTLQASHTITITESGLAGLVPGTFILNVSAPPTTTTTTSIPSTTTTTTNAPEGSTNTTVPHGPTTPTTAGAGGPSDTLPGDGGTGPSDSGQDGDSPSANQGVVPAPGNDDGSGTGGSGDGGNGLVPWIAEALPGPAGDAVSSPFVILGAIWDAITDTWFAAIPLLLLLIAFLVERAIRDRRELEDDPPGVDGVPAQ